MSSDLQIEANRRNAQLSTGPKTPEGKAIVAMNPCVHGLCSRDFILPDESLEDFEALLASFCDLYRPANGREESLVRQAVSAEWRLRRVERFFVGFTISRLDAERKQEGYREVPLRADRTTEQKSHDIVSRLLGLAMMHHSGGATYNKLDRYEASLRRGFFRALKELKDCRIPPASKITEQSQFPPPPEPQPPSLPTDPVAPTSSLSS